MLPMLPLLLSSVWAWHVAPAQACVTVPLLPRLCGRYVTARDKV